MTDYVRIPIREEEHRRLVTLQSTWTGQIDSYLSRPSLSDVIKKLLDHQETQTMNAAQARKLAVQAIQHADSEGTPVADTTVVGIDSRGYWVTDNGEEVNGLTKDGAIEIIVENLTADAA